MPAPEDHATTIDPAEVEKFAAMAEAWWDPNGHAAPLHALNPCRLDWISDQIAAEFGRDRRQPRPFAGLSVLDVGCGGGLLAEPFARLGAAVTGIDAALPSIEVARHHAAGAGLAIDYRATTAEALAADAAAFDVVLAMEIVEHVSDPRALLTACRALTKPGGLFVVSTLNRTLRSRAAAILLAERVLRWLPKGTHDWRRFLTPDELTAMLQEAGLTRVDAIGMVPDILHGGFRRSEDMTVNYAIAAVRA